MHRVKIQICLLRLGSRSVTRRKMSFGLTSHVEFGPRQRRTNSSTNSSTNRSSSNGLSLLYCSRTPQLRSLAKLQYSLGAFSRYETRSYETECETSSSAVVAARLESSARPAAAVQWWQRDRTVRDRVQDRVRDRFEKARTLLRVFRFRTNRVNGPIDRLKHSTTQLTNGAALEAALGEAVANATWTAVCRIRTKTKPSWRAAAPARRNRVNQKTRVTRSLTSTRLLATPCAARCANRIRASPSPSRTKTKVRCRILAQLALYQVHILEDARASGLYIPHKAILHQVRLPQRDGRLDRGRHRSSPRRKTWCSTWNTSC